MRSSDSSSQPTARDYVLLIVLVAGIALTALTILAPQVVDLLK
ncbi:MAG TPA: hypothetical protein VIK33_12760 [Anaerolineae bacterium]